MTDPTEGIRRSMVAKIGQQIESGNPETERARLESRYGQVWDTTQVQADFEVLGFLAPFVSVRRRSDGVKGILMFQHMPRFYFQSQTV